MDSEFRWGYGLAMKTSFSIRLLSISTSLALALSGCGSSSDTPAKPPTVSKPAAVAPKPAAAAPASTNGSGSIVTAPVDYVAEVISAGEKTRGTVDLMAIRKAIDSYHEQENGFPASIDELHEKKYLNVIPRPPVNQQFDYNAQTGEVKLVPKTQ